MCLRRRKLLQGREGAQPVRRRKGCRAGCHLFARCRCCKAAGGNPLWVCLACWANIAEAINGYVKEKEGTHRPIKDPVLDALCNTDFQALRAQAIDAKAKGVRQAGAALDPPLSSLHDV